MAEVPPVVALFGATALGKSDVALELAGLLGADILVADSMQAYAGLPILTNQPWAEARSRARYHLVAWATPQEEVSVARFSRRAHTVVDELLAAGTPVVVEGGSGLYLRAVLGDLGFGSPPDEARRRLLEDRWRRAPEELVAELRARAPDVAARIDLQNGRRVIRALESLDVRPAQTDRLWSGEGRYAYRLFALDPGHDRAALKTRIDRRVDDMLARGALEEVAAARAAGPLSRTAVQAIGVRELCAVLDGELSPAEAATRMKTRTRALARRQLTWMRKLPDAVRMPVAGRSPEVVAGDVLSLIG
ncbi:MAG: tRNA (adenosine(37)-N6)-dimethylallyltransferase MiaA [Acidobacteriota bacterium]|mgnify:FL=1|nr:tRNA (adenosine(37)-N6)-dimethylallyltransferase MiaA [Acidobacteriota bacterium]